MDLLQNFIDKYRVKGFEVSNRRKLKYGNRLLLQKEKGGLWGGYTEIYVYYYDGKATVDSINECLKDYVNVYNDEEFDENDKGFYLCSAINEKDFNSLKRAKIDDNDIRNSIKPFVLQRAENIEVEETPPPRNNGKKKVFIVHGRDRGPALELERVLEKELGLDAVLLQEQPHGGKTIIEKLEDYSNVDYAFVILTPDDVGGLKGDKLKDRTRQNVVLEWGLFVAKIGRDKTCVLLKGDIELPSDMHGIGYYRFNDSVEDLFLKIKKELKNAEILD